VAAPEVARQLANHMVAACGSLHMVVPSEFWGFEIVDFRAYARGRTTPIQECRPREQQRECHELQTLWIFPLKFFGRSVDPREDARWGPLAMRRPIVVNWSPEQREGILVLELKRVEALGPKKAGRSDDQMLSTPTTFDGDPAHGRLATMRPFSNK
jgi:hypothetical protein